MDGRVDGGDVVDSLSDSGRPRGSVQERLDVEERQSRPLLSSPDPQVVLTVICAIEIVLYIVGLCCVIIAEGDTIKNLIGTPVWWRTCFFIVVSQGAAVYLLLLFCGIQCGGVQQDFAVHDLALYLFATVVFHLSSASWYLFGAMAEGQPVTCAVFVITALWAYDMTMVLAYACWLCRLATPDDASKRLLKATVRKRFCQLDETLQSRNRSCCICLEPFDRLQSVMALPCGHVLHKRCGRLWVKSGRACPYRCSPPEVMPSARRCCLHHIP